MKESGSMKVSVSVLSSYERLVYSIKKVNMSSADFLHIDVMDGKFVDNTKFPVEVVKDAKLISDKPLDVHLMVEDINTIKEYAKIKPDYLTFHVEIIKDNEIIKYIKDLGIKVGLAINPETDVKKLLPYINDIDLVLIMSVTPGKGGQEFKDEVLKKVKSIKEKAKKDLIISIDGGINDKTISKVKESGCNMVVSGSFITNSDDYDININKLK